jgi:hypothetical protein
LRRKLSELKEFLFLVRTNPLEPTIGRQNYTRPKSGQARICR